MATSVDTPTSPIPGLSVVNLVPDGEKTLQRFFEENPLYFLAVHGAPAQPNEAHEELFEELPAGWPFTQKFVFGYQGLDGRLAAMANVVSDLLANGVWHVGTFIVETARHGTGDSRALYESLEDWALRSGAQWLRLGVVQGHGRAESFWARCGFVQVARREGVVMGLRTNVIRVMAKPLRGQPLSEYYSLVERDRLAAANAAPLAGLPDANPS
jgi:GNAT superfamily N-acetyltransferase